MVHGPQFSPSSTPFSSSLPFSLFPVQHPGLKILRSDSSSSISSRIGWTSNLSLTLSPNGQSGLFLFFSWTLSSRFLLFVGFYSSSFLLLRLLRSVGLALLLCLADCDHLTNVMSPHCSALPLPTSSSLPFFWLLMLTQALNS